MNFKVGDNVVYPSQGAGSIKETTTRNVLGETQEYFKISFIKSDIEVLVPAKRGTEVGLRHTIKPDELPKLYEAIAQGEIDLPSQWTPRYRAEQDVLASGNAYDLASMIGALAIRDVEKGLAATERQVMDDAKSMLATEIAVVEGINLQEAMARINAAIDNVA